MAPSPTNPDPAGTARARYDGHLERVDDKLAAAAQRSDATFREDTAGAEAKLEKAEDKLEATARKAENR